MVWLKSFFQLLSFSVGELLSSAQTHTLEASIFDKKNYDIIIEAYTSSSTSTILRDSEIITYSPLNTPVLDLTNDNDTLLYKYDDKGETVKVDSS